MANINVLTRRKQSVRLIALALGLCAIGGVGWYLGTPSTSSSKAANKPKAPPPNMTGVVSPTFDKKVGQAAVADIQHTASEAEKKLKAFEKRLEKMESGEQAYRDKIQTQDEELVLLRAQLDGLRENFGAPGAQSGGTLPDGQPLPNFGAGASVPPPTAFYPANNANGTGLMPPQTQYHITPQPLQGLSSMTISYDTPESQKGPTLPYIPSGSFAPAMVIEGADANAAVTGSSDPSPMQMRLTGTLRLPNDETYDLTGCMVTAAAHGDISSERALLRTDRLSCKKDGKTIDMTVDGHVSFKGKNGIKGEPVMRNGKIIGWAGAAGIVDGLGSGIAKVGSETVGVGAVSSMSGSDVARGALGGGASQVGKTLSDYYIKRAEQYHPIIPIGAGTEVTVVFQKGFQLAFIEDSQKKTVKQQVGQAVNSGIQVSQQTLNELKLGDYVAPQASTNAGGQP